MCIAYISIGQPGWPLLVAANRDEFHARPASPLGCWHNDIIAGKDLQAGGTWLGWSKKGRYAFLTNYREPGYTAPANAPSRGKLVTDYLLSELPPSQYAHEIIGSLSEWAGFNLVIGTLKDSWYLTNRNFNNELSVSEDNKCIASPDKESVALQLTQGNYIISNHLLNTPWPKSLRLQNRLNQIPAAEWLQKPELVFETLHDTQKAVQDDLPDTGISKEFEYLLSSPFIVSENYGTRCSSLIAISDTGKGLFSELSYDQAGIAIERNDWPI